MGHNNTIIISRVIAQSANVQKQIILGGRELTIPQNNKPNTNLLLCPMIFTVIKI